MDKVILVTRPKYDDGTEYLSAYALEIIKEANKFNLSVKDFEGKQANRKEIEKYLTLKSPRLVFLNGHGNESEICGDAEQTLFSLENVRLLKNKIVYARACSAASLLGKEIAKDKNSCFIGYLFPFSFWMSNEWSAKPLNDKIASLYLIPSNTVVSLLIRCKTAYEANERSRWLMAENMKEILAMEQKKEPGAMNMLQILWTNYEGQVVLGDKEAKLENEINLGD